MKIILFFLLAIPAMAVPVERVVDFSQEPVFTQTSPLEPDDHWSLLDGKVKKSTTSRAGNTLTFLKLPCEMVYSFYPPRYKHSREEFDDFYATLQLKLEKPESVLSWGILDSGRNTVMMEYDAAGKRARLVCSFNGKKEAAKWCSGIKFNADTRLQLIRTGNQVFFSCNGKFIGAWQGVFPQYTDFGLRINGAQSPAQLTLEKLTISPMPDKAVSSEILPQPGKRSSVQIPDEFENVGGGIGNGYLWGKEDNPEISLRVDNYLDKAGAYIIKIRIMDWHDKLYKSWSLPVKLQANESRIEKIPLPHDKFGYFSLETQLQSSEDKPLEAPRIIGYGITAAEDPRKLSDKSVLGIHGNPFAKLGIKWVRFHDNGVGTYWPGIEPEKGKWQWGYLDAYVNKTNAYGMKALAVLGFTPKWASSDLSKSTYMGKGAFAPAKNMADWENYCRQTVRHLKGRVKYYEVWNEPNGNRLGPKGFFFHGNVEQYYEVLKIAYKAVKEEDPEAIVLAPSGTGHFFPFLERLLELGGGKYFDILSIHTYCTPLPPEIGYHFNAEKSYLHRLNKSRGIMKKYNCIKPVWNTEIGYHTGINARLYGRFLTQDDIAAEALPKYWPNWKRGWSFRPLAPTRTVAFMVRFALLSMVFDVQKCFVHHKLCDVSGDAYMPAPALAWFSRLFNAATFDKTYEDKDQVQVHGFKLDNGKYCIAAWLVEDETLMMKQNRDRLISGLETAPLQGAKQKNIDIHDTDNAKPVKQYFHAVRKGAEISFDIKPNLMYDIWGNQAQSATSLILKETPVYLIYNCKPENLNLKTKYYQYQNGKSNSQGFGSLNGKIIQNPVNPPIINSQKKAVKLIYINLKNAALTDGTSFSGKNWLVLSQKKGLIFTPGPKAPEKGRIVFFLRAASKPASGFNFKYSLTGDDRDIPLSQWKRFPNKVLMKGDKWSLTCGYLITPVLNLKDIGKFTLKAQRSQSHVIKIGIMPVEN